MFQNLVQKAYAADITADKLIDNILTNIINPLVTLMIGVAIIYFFYGVVQFIRNADSPEERKNGGLNMMWGAIGLFVMVTAYGILNLILGTIGK